VRYQYKIVPFIGQNRGRLSAEDVAAQLEALISQNVAAGWEFYQLSDVNIEVRPGCIAGLFGASAQYVRFDQLIFRREEGPIQSTSLEDKQSDVRRRSLQVTVERAVGSPEPPMRVQKQATTFAITSRTAEIWRQKSDEQVRQAVDSLDDYTEESRQIVLAEFEQRSLEPATDSQRLALQALRGRQKPPASGADREKEESLTYCYHCGSDVSPGTSRCAACGNNL
jgi:hypothetical protein